MIHNLTIQSGTPNSSFEIPLKWDFLIIQRAAFGPSDSPITFTSSKIASRSFLNSSVTQSSAPLFSIAATIAIHDHPSTLLMRIENLVNGSNPHYCGQPTAGPTYTPGPSYQEPFHQSGGVFTNTHSLSSYNEGFHQSR